jgi:hypothetical protein
MVVIDNLANFLSISPKQTKCFPSVCLVPAGHFCFSNSVSAVLVSEGYQLNYCWILKSLSGTKNFELLNLCGNQLISIPLLMFFFPSVFGENVPTADFGMISTETVCWDIERE